jgi:hypothetical protein
VRPLAPSRSVPTTPLPAAKAAPTPPVAKVVPAPPVATPATPASRPSINAAEVNARLAGLRPAKATAAPVPTPPPPAAIPVAESEAPAPVKRGWDQRLGPIGIALVAVLAGAAAWLLSSFIK